MRIGIIGAGFAGRAPARLAVQHGHDVMLSNSRDPKTLASVMIRCKVGTARETAEFGDVVLLTVPFATYKAIAPESLAGKIVLDASNYDPQRDGPNEELDNHATTTSELVAKHLTGAYVVKALNAILEKDLERDARPSGTPGRRALPIAGDNDHAKEVASGLLDQLGFDVVDAGLLSEGWRFERGQPAYCMPLDSVGMKEALAAAGSRLDAAEIDLPGQRVFP
jgi:predicted dinucleotide-binding enzyme